MLNTRFLQCYCCGFLCCNEMKDDPAKLICGQCSIPDANQCEYANVQGVMEEITREEFMLQISA